MKKLFYVILPLIFLVFPFKINAIKIDSLNIKGNSTVKSGEQITLTVEAGSSSYEVNEGVWFAYTNLTYDIDHVALIQILSPGYDTYVQYSDEGAIIVSEAIENANVSGTCVNGYLQCGTFTLTLKFQITSITQTTNSVVSIPEFGFATLIINENRDYTIDDAMEITYPSPVNHNLVLQPNEVPKEEKPVVIPESKPTTETKKPTIVKSNNNYLKTLTIKDHELSFNKNTTSYNIELGNDVSVLDIKASVEHAKASYKISGNEKLENGSIVKITVTAEDGETRDYQVNIKKQTVVVTENKPKPSTSEETQAKEEPKENFDILNKNIIMIAGGIVGFFVIVALICVVSNIIDSKRIDKLLEEEK